MTVKLASEPTFGSIARHFGKADPYNKGFFGFMPSDTWTPNVNLYESETCYVVCVDLAGVDKSEIEVLVQDQRLKLTGQRPPPAASPVKGAPTNCDVRLRVHLMEIDHGRFARDVELPADVDALKITATFENGLLWIELPKK